MNARVEALFTLPPTAFAPPPDVFSTVLRLEFAPRFRELGVDAAGFDAFLKVCFAQKRKEDSGEQSTCGGLLAQTDPGCVARPEIPPQARASGSRSSLWQDFTGRSRRLRRARAAYRGLWLGAGPNVQAGMRWRRGRRRIGRTLSRRRRAALSRRSGLRRSWRLRGRGPAEQPVH